MSIQNKSDCYAIKIPKKKIENSLRGYFEKEIQIKYFDYEYPQGILLGILIFEK